MTAVERQVALERKAVHLPGVTSMFGGGRKGRGTSLWPANPAALPKRPPRRLPSRSAPQPPHADFCICYSLCLSERPSPETSTAPLGLSIHFRLPKGNFPCPPDHNHSPTYAVIASFSRGTFHGEMLLFTYVFLRLMSISPT